MLSINDTSIVFIVFRGDMLRIGVLKLTKITFYKYL